MTKQLADLSVEEIVSLSEAEIDLVHGAKGFVALEFAALSGAREFAH